MTSDGQMPVRLGNTRITVPVYQTKARTEQLVEELNARLKALETEGGRIDTQVYALQLAFHYAVEAAEARRAADEETGEFARALQRILDALRALADIPDTPDDGDKPSPDPPSNLTPFRA